MPRYSKLISFAIPCFNEQASVQPCYEALIRLTTRLSKYRYEFVFVDNGSTDKTALHIQKLAKLDKRVKGIFLSRNFGPEASGQAILDFTTGDAVIPYEADMQDPPDVIRKFIVLWEKGFDTVVGVRTKISDSLAMTIARRTYYRLFQLLSDVDVPVNAGAFCLLDRKVVDTLRALPESYRFFRGLRAWVGFKTVYVTYTRRKRIHGKSSYSLWNYFQHAQRSFFGFSYVTLSLLVYSGFLYGCIAILVETYQGWTTSIVQIFRNLGMPLGILIISTIGKYVQVVFEETKRRPIYVVSSMVNVPQRSLL